MRSRVIALNKFFELREEQVRQQNTKKMRKIYRIRLVMWIDSEQWERMRQLIDPLNNRGFGRSNSVKYRRRREAEQAWIMLSLAAE